MKVNVYKIEISVVDFDRLGERGLVGAIERATYPNRCVCPQVHSIESRAIDWSDDHPLNKTDTAKAEFDRLFSMPRETRSAV